MFYMENNKQMNKRVSVFQRTKKPTVKELARIMEER